MMPLAYSLKFKQLPPLSSVVEIPVQGYAHAEVLAKALVHSAGIKEFIVTHHRKVIGYLEYAEKEEVCGPAS